MQIEPLEVIIYPLFGRRNLRAYLAHAEPDVTLKVLIHSFNYVNRHQIRLGPIIRVGYGYLTHFERFHQNFGPSFYFLLNL